MRETTVKQHGFRLPAGTTFYCLHPENNKWVESVTSKDYGIPAAKCITPIDAIKGEHAKCELIDGEMLEWLIDEDKALLFIMNAIGGEYQAYCDYNELERIG